MRNRHAPLQGTGPTDRPLTYRESGMTEKIIQCGYMSGDTYAAAALLAADLSAQIVLVKDTNATGQYADKSDLIHRIYRESGVSARVKVFDISKGKIRVNELWKGIKDAYKTRRLAPSRDGSLPSELYYCTPAGWPRSITAVTGLLAKKWQTDPDTTSKAIATAWKVGRLPTEQKFALYGYMSSKFRKINFDITPNIIVLWSRQSGKNGGAHPELDSSYKGIRQLARAFIDCGKSVTVLLAGDDKKDKLGYFANEPDMDGVISVSEMWEQPVWKEQFGEARFLAQFAFFKYLAEDYNVIHVGMRSGMLESMALLGMRAFYLEGTGSGSGDRMGGFGSAGIRYSRIEIERAPGLTGRISEKNNLYTKDAVNGRIKRLANAQWKRRDFWGNFPGKNPNNNWAAINYAKAQLLGEPLTDASYGTGDRFNQMWGDMNDMRGFSRTVLEKIVGEVVAHLKHAE